MTSTINTRVPLALLLPALLTATAMALGQSAGARTPKSASVFYVDNVGGSDSNSGATPSTAIATIGHLSSLLAPGATVYFRCGDTWHEFLNALSIDGVTVSSYGSGANPVIDCSTVTDASAWNAYTAGGASHTWSASMAVSTGIDEQPGVWDNSATGGVGQPTHLRPVAPIWNGADSNYAPGQYVTYSNFGYLCISSVNSSIPPPSDGSHWTAQTDAEMAAVVEGRRGSFFSNGATVFVDTYAGMAPTNGEVAVAVRDGAIWLGDDANVANIQTQRNLHNGGSLQVGRHSVVRQVRVLDGSKHNLTIGSGTVYDSTIHGQGLCADYGGGYSAIGFYFNGTGVEQAHLFNVIASYDWTTVGGETLTTAHADGGGSFNSLTAGNVNATNFYGIWGNLPTPGGTIQMQNCSFTDVRSPTNVDGVSVTSVHCSYTQVNNPWQIPYEFDSNLSNPSAAGSLVSIGETFNGDCQISTGLIWIRDGVTGARVTLIDPTFNLFGSLGFSCVAIDGNSVTGTGAICTLTMTGATISGANPGGVIPVNIASDEIGSVTLNLSGNQYQNGSIFYYYGTLEPTLQAWQSASGQDLGMGTTFIAAQPESQTIANGSTAVFTVAASGPAQMASLAGYGEQSVALFSGTTYQWQFDGNALADGDGVSGSTGPQLMIQGASASDDGDYACLVTSGGDSMLSNPANLLVGEISNPGTLVNMSARGWVGTGDNVLIGGFYIVGSTSRTVLIQALGPALSGDGVSGTLQRPVLTIHNSSGATIYSNSGWGSNEILLEAAAAAYADPVLQPHSADSELLLTLPPGGYTAEIAGADGGSGVALCATYQLP